MHIRRAYWLEVALALATAGCETVARNAERMQPDDGGPDTSMSERDAGPGPSVQRDCASIGYLPPIVTVRIADQTDAACDASFTLLDSAGGESSMPDVAMSLCGAGLSRYEGCPDPAADAAAGACTYALWLPFGRPYTVRVSKDGYSAVTVEVLHGVNGCVPTEPATHVTVELTPSDDDAG